MLENFKQRIVSKFFNQPSHGAGAAVMRNYNSPAAFQPQRQVVGITYKAIDKIGQSLSDYEIYVKKANGDLYQNHPVLTLFDNPNPKQTASDFTHLYAMLYEIYGETFWYLAKGENTNKTKEIYLLPPDRIEVKIYGGELVGYILHKLNGEQVPFTPDEIIHDKRPNPFNEWRGMSIIERAAAYIDTEINVTAFTLNYIKNAASPSGIVTLPAMGTEAFNSFVAQWREGYEGPENAGKTAFIRKADKDTTVGFQAVGATLKDIDQKVTKDMATDDVLMMLDVPKPLLGMSDQAGLGRGNVETLNYIFASEKLEPMMKRLDRIWENIAIDMMGGQKVDISHESPIPEDKEFLLKQNTELLNKAITANEVRAMMGLDPIQGGDELMPQNTVPNLPTKSYGKKVVKIVKKKEISKSEEIKKITQTQENFRSKLVDTNEAYTKRYKSALSKFAGQKEKEVVANINASSKVFDEWLFNVKDATEELVPILMPIILELIQAQSQDTANFITGEALTITDKLKQAMEIKIKQVAGVYNTDTITALEKTLTAGQAAGESLASLKSRVESVFSDAKGYRAERIARTETLKTSNSTAEQVYKENGYNYVEWFINPNACEFCQSMAGQTKSIGSTFLSVGDVLTGVNDSQLAINYDSIDTPPLHPNCTCTLIPIQD